jgi:hypothetical protein
MRRKTVHGVTIGIMMLDTGFERVAGDIGFAPTWSFPVHYRVIAGATGDRVMSDGGGNTLDLFLQALTTWSHSASTVLPRVVAFSRSFIRNCVPIARCPSRPPACCKFPSSTPCCPWAAGSAC